MQSKKLKQMKNEIKEIMVIVILVIVAIIIAYLCELFQVKQVFVFAVGSLYTILGINIYKSIVENEPDPSQETEIMYFEKTSELQEWTEKLKKEEVEVVFFGTTLNATVNFYDLIDADKIKTYCIIYKF
jgi:hypothetical protein